MSLIQRHAPFLTIACGLLCGCLTLEARGQQAAPGALPARSASPEVGAQATSSAAKKEEILKSECWHRAMFELNQWFSTQSIYTPEEVAELKADFVERVNTMSVEELQAVITDLDAKFRILDSPQAREAREWFGQYLSVLADRRRDEVLRDIPNFATMTPAELTQEILKIQRKKGGKARFHNNRQSQVTAQLQANRAAQAAIQQRPRSRATYQAPYRPANRERPFDNVQIGPQRGMLISPEGQIWMGF
jgi:hypothetical protein